MLAISTAIEYHLLFVVYFPYNMPKNPFDSLVTDVLSLKDTNVENLLIFGKLLFSELSLNSAPKTVQKSTPQDIDFKPRQ